MHNHIKDPKHMTRKTALPRHLFEMRPAVLAAAVISLGLAATPAAGQSTILIDFGFTNDQMPSPNTDSNYWNNVTQTDATSGSGGAVGNSLALVASDNSASGITLTMTDLFENENSTGTTAAPTTSVSAFNFTELGTDSLFIADGNPDAAFTLTGLNSANTYRFTLFAARSGVSDVRSAEYSFTGSATDTVELDAANNTSAVVTTAALAPDASQTITFSMQKAASNTNGSGFAYLGGMQVEVIPEPSAAAFVLWSGLCLLLRRGYRAAHPA